MLEDLLGLLRNANPKVVIHVLQSLKYEPLLTLVNYYQLVRKIRVLKMVPRTQNNECSVSTRTFYSFRSYMPYRAMRNRYHKSSRSLILPIGGLTLIIVRDSVRSGFSP